MRDRGVRRIVRRCGRDDESGDTRTLVILRHAKAANPRAGGHRPTTHGARPRRRGGGRRLAVHGVPARAGAVLPGAAHPGDLARRRAGADRRAPRSVMTTSVYAGGARRLLRPGHRCRGRHRHRAAGRPQPRPVAAVAPCWIRSARTRTAAHRRHRGAPSAARGSTGATAGDPARHPHRPCWRPDRRPQAAPRHGKMHRGSRCTAVAPDARSRAPVWSGPRPVWSGPARA